MSAALVPHKTSSESIAATAMAYHVVDEDSCQQAVTAGLFIAEQIELRRPLITPTKQKAYEVYKDLLAMEKAILGTLEKAKDHLRGEVEAYRALKRATVQQSLAAATSHAEVREAVAAVVTTPEGMHEREDWSAVVDDPNLLPREYMIPDYARLNREAAEQKQAYNVPGSHAVCRKVPVFSAAKKR